MTISAAAPSLMPEALPAVTVPSLENAGRRRAMPSMFESWRMYSSSATWMSPLRVFTVTGAISSLNRPLFCAAEAFCCDFRANCVLLLAGDLVLGGDVLRRGAHVVAVERVPQPVLQHGVDEFQAAHLGAVAQKAACADRLMLSMPPAATMLLSPVRTCCAARATARRPEPHTWLMPKAVAASGMPAARAAWRDGFWPSPAARTWP